VEVLVGGLEGAGHDGLVGLVEAEEGHAHASPSSVDRREDVGLVGYEGALLIECQFEDSAALFLGGEGGEDLVVEAEVGWFMWELSTPPGSWRARRRKRAMREFAFICFSSPFFPLLREG